MAPLDSSLGSWRSISEALGVLAERRTQQISAERPDLVVSPDPSSAVVATLVLKAGGSAEFVPWKKMPRKLRIITG